MSIRITSTTHKLSIHASEGRNPLMGRAEPYFNDSIEYFEGELLETERNVRTGEILEMKIVDISHIQFNGYVESIKSKGNCTSFSVKFK